MFFTPAYAQTGGAGEPSLFFQFIPFILIFVIMYFLIIRPQQRKMREHREMLSQLRRGDEIVTAGGVLGKITRVKDNEDEIEVEISQGVKIRVVKSTVSTVVSRTEPANSNETK